MILEKKNYFGSGYPREGLAVIKNKRIVYFAIAFSTLLMNICETYFVILSPYILRMIIAFEDISISNNKNNTQFK